MRNDPRAKCTKKKFCQKNRIREFFSLICYENRIECNPVNKICNTNIQLLSNRNRTHNLNTKRTPLTSAVTRRQRQRQTFRNLYECSALRNIQDCVFYVLIVLNISIFHESEVDTMDGCKCCTRENHSAWRQ